VKNRNSTSLDNGGPASSTKLPFENFFKKEVKKIIKFEKGVPI
jgi:hypothetical protein